MKEVVIISGKGGTGKTSLAATFVQLAKNKVVAADCDVDAADMHLLLHPDFGNKQDFYSGYKAQINPSACIDCGECAQRCRFNAIDVLNGNHVVDNISCEGCGYCAVICPANAVLMKEDLVGECYISDIVACKLVHARLKIGAGNSGKLVAHVKNTAHKIARSTGRPLILVDGPPGIGCPVISSLTGAHLVVLVTEPTVSGLHDLKRVYALVKKSKIHAACIINKCDINPLKTKEIEEYLKEKGIAHISNIAYNESFSKSLSMGKTILEYPDKQLIGELVSSWEKIDSIIENL